MGTYFVEGNNYTNSPTNYGLRPYDVQNDAEAASMPDVTYTCCAVTKTFAVFKRTQPTGSGATANPGWLLGQTQRLRVRRDATGLFVMPLGRRNGAVILRPTNAPVIDPFWANACTTGAVSVNTLNTIMASNVGTLTNTGQTQRWMVSQNSLPPYLGFGLGYSSGDTYNAFGQVVKTVCLVNDTGAAVTPKVIFFQNVGNIATITGTLNVTINNITLGNTTNGSIDFSTSPALSLPVMPAGTSATVVITVTVTNVTAASGAMFFGLSL